MMKKILFINCGHEEITSRWIKESFKYSIERSGYTLCQYNIKTDDKSHIINQILLLSKNDLILADLRDHHIDAEYLSAFSNSLPVKFNILIDSDLTFELSNLVCYNLFDKTLVSFNSTYKRYSANYSKITYFPYCGYVSDKLPSNGEKRKRSLVFIGSPTPVRLRYLSLLQMWKIPLITNLTITKKIKFKIPYYNYKFKNKLFLYIFIRFSNLLGKIFSKNIHYDRQFLSKESYSLAYTQNLVALGIMEYGRTGLVLPIAYNHIRMRDLEALCSGCLLVTRKNSDIKTLMNAGIKIYTYVDNKTLKSAVMEALSETEVDIIIKKNLEILKNNFDWGKNLSQLHLNEFTNER
jgi:hypothetical protein